MPRETIEGSVERVTFFNEENGFAVLRVKVSGQRDLVTVLGSLPAVNGGEWIIAQGTWERSVQHGTQFRAENLRANAPNSREGIEKYLGSGMIKGIGPVLAKKLVSKFGEGVFEIIETQSARLQEVDKVGPERRRRIKAAWAEQKIVRAIMVFLHSHGASASRAVRIYKTYGEQAVAVVSDNPYRLAKDIHGIGFKTADAMARRLGVAADSIQRATAGLRHTLFEATNQGHCALPDDALLRHATSLLEVDEAVVKDAVSQAITSGELERDEIGEEPLIYLPGLLGAERAIARRILQLASLPPVYPEINLDQAVIWYESKSGRDLSPSQRVALAQALGSRVFIITGGPGVGKTTLLDSVLAILRAKGVRCLLCAPTGRAAQRLGEATGMEAKTIHRLLEFGPGGAGFVRKEDHPLDGDLIVVDECSMVDVPLMHALLRAVPPRASLLLVGDMDQLPSVGPGLVLRHLIESNAVPTARLTEIFRQAASSRIITSAHAINAGHLPDLRLPADGAETDFFFIERDDPERIAATLCELAGNRIPKKLGLDAVRDIQVLCPSNRGPVGARALNVTLQNALNPALPHEPFAEKFGWRFQLRDKVIQTQNNYDKEVFNGDLGFVDRIDTEEGEITVRFETRSVVYAFGELDELAPAYAITIHKSQGSEFPVVLIPLAMSHYILLQRNLLYTGLTRGRRLVVFVGQRRALECAVRQQTANQRYSGLLARLLRNDHPDGTTGR